ncbi:hypothetical protein EC991_002500 [Linnemannia zychae]|nr:hypothetical protein EC991_002500 [Linnemannia zychae]
MDWYLKAAYLGDNNARYKIDRFRLELPRLFSSSRAPLLEGLEDVQQDKRRDKVMAGISSLDVTIDTAEGLALSCQNNSSAMQEKVKLEERVPGNQKEMKQLQPRVLSQLDVLQYHVQAVLTRFYEPREYPISRLFVVLPQDPSSWDAVNPFKNKFRLYFLCECGEHTKSISSEIEISHDIHFAKHEGYEIVRPSEFFQQYGFYILTLLKMLKFGVSVAGITVPNISHLVRSDANDQAANSLQQLRDSIERGMDSIIDWMEKIFVNEGETADEFSKQMERKEALGCADIRKLHTFLKVKDGSMVLGNLLKTVTDRGHTRWVCIDHYRVKYQENPAKEFLRVLDSVGGLFMENIGRVKVRLGSSISAEQFFSALRKARFVYELDINFDWDCDTNDLSDLDELEDALKESRVSDIRLDLRRFQTVNQLSPHALLSPSKQYNFIFRIRDLPNMRVLHILFSKDLVKFLGVQQKESRNACKTSCELVTTLINEEEFRILEEALKTDSTLTTLGLAGSSIGDNGAKTLAEVLKTNLTLTTLDLMNNSIGYGGAQALSEALKTNSTLTTLILDGNSIGSHGVQTLSEALKTNSTLTTLHLSYNTIGDGGAKALAEALKTNLTLTTLELKNNWIGSGGAQPLSEALKTNSTLTTLNLDGNSIGSGGVQALSEALKTNSALTNLHLDNNWIGDGGSKALAEALKTNLTLTTLELERNSIGYGGAQALSEALKTNSTLTTLNLDRNSIGSHGVYVLAEALKTNSTLTALHLNNNWIGSDGARVLSEALKTNSTLTTLHLYNNWIGSDVAKALDEALKTD